MRICGYVLIAIIFIQGCQYQDHEQESQSVLDVHEAPNIDEGYPFSAETPDLIVLPTSDAFFG